ncbi:MAG: SDR family oxidoreductase [Bacteroidota bacterium]
MPFTLTSKIALVTGGASGIGAAICRIFAQAGAQVFILDQDLGKAGQLADEIGQSGAQAHAVQADVTNQDDMVAVVEDIVEQAGKLDILVNNAGIAHIGTLETTSEADFERLYAVNIKGVYNGMYAVIQQMKIQQQGVILNMGSIAASIGLPDRFAYSMTKGAVLNMTYTVARDYISHNIRCNSISPARVHTPFVDNFLAQNYPGQEKEMFAKLSATQPIGRMAKPEEVAHLALYLCSDEAAFITGTDFPIDGGFIRLNT